MKREHLDDKSEKSIRSEVGTLQALSHPNIIRGLFSNHYKSI